MPALYVEVQIIGHVIVPLHIQKATVQDLQADDLKDPDHVQDLALEVVHQKAENTGQDQEIDLDPEIERNDLVQNQNLLPGQDLDQDLETRNEKNLLNLQNEKAKREKGKENEIEIETEIEIDPNLLKMMTTKVVTKKIKKAKTVTMKKMEMEKKNINPDQDLHLFLLLQIRNNVICNFMQS